MHLKNNFHVAVPTAFNRDESLNIENTFKHIEYLANQGVQSVLISGSTGEQHSLSLEEKMNIIDYLPQLNVPHEFEIIFGLSAIRQKEAELLAQKISQSASISAILLGFPPYILPSQSEARSYALALMNKAQKPTILYNNPARTGFDLTIASYLQLIETQQVIGIKEAGRPENVKKIIQNTERSLLYFAGGEKGLDKKVQMEFNALSSIAGNLFPKEVADWFQKLLQGKQDTEKQQLISQLYSEKAHSLLPTIKKAIAEKEKIAYGVCRSPLGNE